MIQDAEESPAFSHTRKSILIHTHTSKKHPVGCTHTHKHIHKRIFDIFYAYNDPESLQNTSDLIQLYITRALVYCLLKSDTNCNIYSI